MSKRGQYFTIEAFAALLVVVTGLLLILAVSSPAPSTAPPHLLSQELASTLSQTRIKEINNLFVARQLSADNITNPDNTLFQQAYEFKRYFDSNLDGNCAPTCHGYEPSVHTKMSAELLESAVQTIVPGQYNFEIIIDGDVLLSKGTGQDTAALLISSKRIIFGVVNKSVEFWGPVTAEVRVWR